MTAMRPGTDTGSLINHLYSRQTLNQPEPFVGMGATVLHWTDREAGTIIAVEKVGNDTIITVQSDEAKVIGGGEHDGSASYEFSPNLNGRLSYFRLSKIGWTTVRKNEQTGRWNKIANGGVKIGVRDHYRDPSF